MARDSKAQPVAVLAFGAISQNASSNEAISIPVVRQITLRAKHVQDLPRLLAVRE